jgi:Fe-S-cluster-containing dehydrogenase component
MKTKALVIDYKYCTGCHTCEIACRNEKELSLDEWGIKLADMGPVELDGKWRWDYIPVPSQLCDLCEERMQAGEKPACVHHCLAQCLEVVDIEDIPEAFKRLGDGVTCFVPFK